jgi:creatinine amidohydrolase
MGDPTLADAETGRLFLEAAIDATVELVQEMRALPILQRKDHH